MEINFSVARKEQIGEEDSGARPAMFEKHKSKRDFLGLEGKLPRAKREMGLEAK